MVDRLLGRTHPEAAPQPESPTAIAWAHVQQARNLKRPHTLELLKVMADEFVELHGDRFFGDDLAIVAGLAKISGRRLAVIGFQKGQELDENLRRNFGLPHPEGYRKAMRVMDLAERFSLPVLTFVDVQGAFPGAASEERGIAEAIAKSVGMMSRLRTPIVVVITGEGGSGGALALAVGDCVLALENSIYSVISPEGCAAILFRSSEQSQQAAVAMKVTAAEQKELGIVDEVILEPGDGRSHGSRRDRPARPRRGQRPTRGTHAHAARRAHRGAVPALPIVWAVHRRGEGRPSDRTARFRR